MAEENKLQLVHTAIKKKFKDKTLVFGHGAENAHVVFVAEIVGPEEEKEKKALAGTTLKALSKALKDAGIDKKKAYFTSLVKYSPGKGNIVHPKEIKIHSTFLKEELHCVSPKIVVTLGNLALNGVGLRQPVENVHGRTFNMGSYELLPTFHPTVAAGNPSIKLMMDMDLKRLKELIELKKNQVQNA